MKNLMKRGVALVLAVMMCVGMLSLNAFAAGGSWCEEHQQYRTVAACGGSYCVENNQAVHITKGSNGRCVDVKNGGDGTTDPHDHQCDYCHAWMEESITSTITKQPSCTEEGLKVYSCTHSGCSKNNATETIPMLEADLGDTCVSETVDGVTTHYLVCTHCNGAAGGTHKVAQKTTTVTVGATCQTAGSTVVTCDHCGAEFSNTSSDKLTANFEGASWIDDKNGTSHHRNCQNADCEHTEPGHVETENHWADANTGWGDLELVADAKSGEYADTDGSNKVTNFDAGTQKLYKVTRTCKCTYSQVKYTVVPRIAIPVRVQYVVRGQATNVLASEDAGWVYDGGNTLTISPKEDMVPAGYSLVPDQDDQIVSFVADLESITVLFYVEPASYNLTVEIYVNGVQESSNTTPTLYGTSITNPGTTRTGYYTPTVEGYVETMPAHDLTIVVRYTSIPTPEPPEPPEESPSPSPTPSTEPEVEIDEPETPLTEEPEIDEPEIEIDEPETPLAPEPEIVIDEAEVPLANVPQTGDMSMLWYAAAALPVCGLAVTFLPKKKEDVEE